MPGLNLTRDEARERAEQLAVQSYNVDLDLTVGDITFTSVTEIVFSGQGHHVDVRRSHRSQGPHRHFERRGPRPRRPSTTVPASSWTV